MDIVQENYNRPWYRFPVFLEGPIRFSIFKIYKFPVFNPQIRDAF